MIPSQAMETLGTGRIFADSYQFYVYDDAYDPFETLPEWDEANSARGFIADTRAVCLGTRAHLNDHWVELFVSAQAPEVGEAERVLAFNLSIQGNALALMGPTDGDEDILRFEVSPGDYTLFVLAYNIGTDAFSTGELEDQDDDDDLTDEELAARTDYERYRLILVPGHSAETGVVHGDANLPPGSSEPIDE